MTGVQTCALPILHSFPTRRSSDLLEAPKKSWNGLNARRRLLAEAGIRLPDRLDCGSVAADDLLDAAVAAWSAQRIAAGTARALPESPSPDADPRIGRIWY